MPPKHPRDQFLSVYGRKPVMELLQMPDVRIDKLLLAANAKGELIAEILELCRQRGIIPLRSTAQEVSRFSKNPTQDQGIVADVAVEHMDDWNNYLQEQSGNRRPLAVVAFDGVTTPANVGMVIRSATALGVSGILLPRKGCSDLNPLVIKASAGVVFRSHLLKCETLPPALEKAKQAGFLIYALDAGAGSVDIYQQQFAERCIFVMGNESVGIAPATARLVDKWLQIPMFNGVESLNVACAASIVAAEWRRRL